MSTQRETNERCPLNEKPVHMDMCQPCIYFRGASNYTGKKGWTVCCNWPRNGSEIAITPIPRIIEEAFHA